MMNRHITFRVTALLLTAVLSLFVISCSSVINTNFDPRFTADGQLINAVQDSARPSFSPQAPSRIKFYIEVSGSMNGYFRAGVGTDFQTDVWQVMSYYSPLAPDVAILTNGGTIGQRIPLSSFRNRMNTGAFVSAASTKVPVMLQTIIEDLNADAGEVAVLISDMKYDPVGSAAPNVLLKQYSTDISNIFASYGKAVSLICAKSNYVDKKGNNISDTSPYYYLVIGNSEQVAEMRNGISTLLNDQGHFIDNIETGMKYGAVSYSFGIPLNCWQMALEEPTFCGYDPSEDDTCTIRLNIPLENYRWRITDNDVLASCIKAKCLYGSEVKIGKISIEINNKFEKQLKRKATATVELKLTNMATESDVIEWTLELPDSDYTLFSPYIEDVTDVNDNTKSYSVYEFIRGMFYGGVLNSTLMPNYILVSQNS